MLGICFINLLSGNVDILLNTKPPLLENANFLEFEVDLLYALITQNDALSSQCPLVYTYHIST